MNTKAPCRSKQPAFCAYHGVPQGNLSFDTVKDKLSDVKKEQKAAFKSFDIAKATELQDETVALESRLYFLAYGSVHRKAANPSNLPAGRGAAHDRYLDREEAKYNAELKEYRTQLAISLAGEDTPFVRSLSGGGISIPTALVLRSKAKKVKEFDIAPNDSNREEVKAKAESYARRHGFDGVILDTISAGESNYFIPYKLQAGEMSPEAYYAKAAEPQWKQLEYGVKDAAYALRHGKKRQLAALAK